jgi:peroxiredoxin
MLQSGEQAPAFSLRALGTSQSHALSWPAAAATLVIFFETDCPTCQLTFPYLSRLAERLAGRDLNILAISQDPETATTRFAEQMSLRVPVLLDEDLAVSRQFDPLAVPSLFLLDGAGRVLRTQTAFDKAELNAIAAELCARAQVEPFELAAAFDGAPATKPGCTSRHLEPPPDASDDGAANVTTNLYAKPNTRAARIELNDEADAVEYCLAAGFDALPVVPPTVARVERMLRATSHAPEEVIALIPPNYGQATVEKIAANAVMAGCEPALMRVLLPLVRAACDERFNLHGVQATTHFAAPLIIVNGPVRNELEFASGSNVFSNVARANSTLGRAFQLMLTNLGGARPGEIDMSTLGNPGKFAYCIAEREELNPWEPLHVEQGCAREQSAVTLFAAEPPRAVSEHRARSGRTVLKALCRALATVWSYRMCAGLEAVVVLCPEHVATIHRDGFSKQQVREYLFEHTGIPVRAFELDEDGEGVNFAAHYERVTIDGEACYRKFRAPEQIKIVVAGGTAGKFSAVLGSWTTGPRGSQMVTYPLN